MRTYPTGINFTRVLAKAGALPSRTRWVNTARMSKLMLKKRLSPCTSLLVPPPSLYLVFGYESITIIMNLSRAIPHDHCASAGGCAVLPLANCKKTLLWRSLLCGHSVPAKNRYGAFMFHIRIDVYLFLLTFVHTSAIMCLPKVRT